MSFKIEEIAIFRIRFSIQKHLLYIDLCSRITKTLYSGLQQAFNDFEAACGNTEIKKNNSSKTYVILLHFLGNLVQYFLQIDRVLLKHVKKLKYLWVVFMSDGRQDKRLDVRLGKASALMRALHHLIILEW